MNKLFIWALIVIAAALLTSLLLQHDGHVTLSMGDYVIETSLAVAGTLVIAIAALVYLLLWLLHALWRLPKRWRERRQLKRLLKAESDMETGLLASEEGNWRAAEKALARSARLARNGAMYYLAAARMAHQQKAFDRRDQYLRQAREQFPEAYDTIALAEARMRRDDQPDKALTLLQSLIAQDHDKPAILEEYARLLAQLERWDTLEALLPRLRQRKAMPPDALTALEREIYRHRLAAADTLETLHARWTSMPRHWQDDPEVAAAYVRRHMQLGDEQGLAGLIERLLKRRWTPALVYLYGQLSVPSPLKRLQTAEQWLKKHEDDPVLLLTLGRLACSARVWGQAQHYLRRSLQLRPALETFATLAECLEAEGAGDRATLVYREALQSLKQQPQSLPASVLGNDRETDGA